VAGGGRDEEHPHAEEAEPGEDLDDGELAHGGGHLGNGPPDVAENGAQPEAGRLLAAEGLDVSGMPLAVAPSTPSQRSSQGSALAMLAPTPMKNDCITKPAVRCWTLSLSATKARNGSIEMLMEASRIQSRLAAIHSEVEVGMKKSATEARIAPVRK
jgi:hypothetical protein